ncbi:MAG: UvrD-helicase domain-containing protein, partial [Armatimonadota bacterium]
MNLSPKQIEAIECNEPDFTIVAAAGSGKTRVIVARYVRLVKAGLSPSQILTITFTRKAAGEMRSRIVKTFLELGMVDEAQECETGPIQTIHSFCERLLKENAIYAGLDPKFKICEGAEGTVRFDAALRAVLDTKIDEYPNWVDFIRHRSGKSQYRAQTTLTSFLREEVGKVLSAVRGSNWTYEEFARSHRDPDALKESWAKHLCEDAGVAVPGDTPMSLVLSQIQSVLKPLRKVPSWASGKVDDEAEMRAAEDACALGQLAAEVWAELELGMLRDQAFDFNLLESLAVKLLTTNEDALQQTREQYKVVLVDESQDVNPTQFKLLDAIKAESHVMVGDAQQSIYGFRLADRELLMRRTKTTPTVELDKNYRSDQGILAFADMVFGSWWHEYRSMRPSAADLDVVAPPMVGVELWPGPRENRSLVAANIAELVQAGTSPKDIAVLVRSSRYGIQLRGELDQLGVPNLLVGGNESFYTRMEVHDLANALEALADPSDTLAMVSLLHGPFVGLSTDAVFEIALEPVTLERIRSYDPRNSLDFERLEAFSNWYFELVEYADRLPAWEVCSRLFARTGYLPAIVGEKGGLRALANVRKLFVQATQQPDVRAHEFAEQIRSIQRLRHQESEAEQIDQDADAVKIMTTHKAKGLEFDTVVVPEFLRTRQR